MPPDEVTIGDTDTTARLIPYYKTLDGVVSLAGVTADAETINTHYPEHVSLFPDIDPWYVARFYAPSSVLTTISEFLDTVEVAGTDLAPLLNDIHTGEDRTAAEWNEVYTA